MRRNKQHFERFMSRQYTIPSYLHYEAQGRKERALRWFHRVTSELNPAQIVLECIRLNLPVEGRTLHQMQTELLQSDGQPQVWREAADERFEITALGCHVPQHPLS